MRELKPNWVSKLIKYSPAAIDCLSRNGQTDDAFIQGGANKDGTLGWLVRGAALEVFSNTDGQRIAAWCFGIALKDQQTVITAVTEYTYDNGIKLLVATTTPNSETALLSVFDVKTSKVLKCIEIPYQVTSLENISNVGGEQLASVFSEHLRCFCGVVAVGTLHGHTYLLDMCIDDDTEESDEIRPNGLIFLDPRTGDIGTKRYNAMTKRKHLCLELDEESHGRGYFYFRKPDGSVIKTYAEAEVEVTSLKFMKQTGSLAVGFNFGCFQLWRLGVPVLEYSSRFEDGLEALLHFAYQEPENDPRNFAYLWVIRGPLPHNSIEEGISSISLFQLGYSNKKINEQLGYLFEELTSVCQRFDHVLTENPLSSGDENSVGSRIVSCFTIHDTRQSHLVSHEDDSFESLSGPDQSLCAFVWEAAPADPHSKSIYHLGIFDINRWYHAQMPFSIRSFGHSYESCNYFAFYSIEEVADAIGSDNLMGVHIGYDSISRYNSCIIPAPEQHFWPSSLAFDAVCIAETGLVSCRCLGAQRQVLSQLQRQGPSVLLEPRDIYSMCLSTGLFPRNMDISVGNVSAVHKRDAILTVALDHNMVNWLAACVHQFTSQEFISAGCNLRSMLDWAWARVGHMKENLDRLCISLYDWTGVSLDRHTLHVLQQYHTSLHHLVSIFQLLASESAPSTVQGQRDLEAKVGVVTLIGEHLQMVLWFHGVGLLPERSEDEEISDGDYCYPIKLLRDRYTMRRQDIQKNTRDVRSTDILLIDGLLEEMGPSVQHLFEKEGGNGLYPPPSFHTVMNLYLLESIPITAKHTAVLYLLFDLMNLEENTDLMPERVGNFLATFNIPQSLAKLVQGLWSVDHKRFDDAMLMLLDPSIKSELVPWQHTRIIKSMLYQKAPKMALKYMRIKRLPLQTPEDVKLRLTVLLANGLTAEAYEYQRICRDQLSGDDLLSHLFLACHQTRTVDRLLQLPMRDEEEHRLVDYLKNTQEANSSELLLLHYLQRSRFIEAVRLNNKLKNTGMGETDALSRERATARNAIVDCYHHVLPRVQRKLAFGPEQLPRKPTQTRKEVARPAPLSSVVNRVQRSQAVTQAMLINSVMEKVREVTDECNETTYENESGPSSAPSSSSSDAPGPFICTPITPRTTRKMSEAPELIFASVKATAAEQSIAPGASPYKRSHASPLSGIPYGDSLRLSDAAKRRMSRYYSSEALSLLQTPPVRRKTPSKTPAPSSLLSSTPQSILKVRTQSRRSPSPRELLKAKLAAEIKMPTPPRFTRTLTDITPADSAASSVIAEPPSKAPSIAGSTSSSLPGTPKQLRFSVPVSPESPMEFPLDGENSPATTDSNIDEEESKNMTLAEEPLDSMELDGPSVRPSLRSTRDRSPTPERLSPKASPNTDILPKRTHPRTQETHNSTEEDEYELVDAITLNANVQIATNLDNSDEDLPTEEAITFNFNKSREVLDVDEEPEDMDTDADTEPWVGTVKSIQAQSEDEVRDNHTLDDLEDMNEEVVSSQGEEEIETKESQEDGEEVVTEDAASEVENNEIVLKLDDSESEPSQEENCDIEVQKNTYVISNTAVAEAVVNSKDDKEMDATNDKNTESNVIDKVEEQDEPDSTTGRVSPEQHHFKTPPRPTRLSVMPPTPPESGQGTPPQQPSPSVSRSRETSPVSTTSQDVRQTTPTRKSRLSESQIEPMDHLSARVTRSSSRSVSPVPDKNTETVKASVKRTPSRRGRPKKSPQPVDQSAVDEAPSTPSRRSTRSASREPEIVEPDGSPSRKPKIKVNAETPPRTKHVEDGGADTPSRRTRGSVARAVLADDTEPSASAVTPRKPSRSKSPNDRTPDTPSRVTRAARDAETPERLTPSRTRSLRARATTEESAKKTVSTPLRRGRSFKATTADSAMDTDIPEVITPRRGRSAKTPERMIEETEPITPTRRGRPKVSTVTPERMTTPRKGAVQGNVTPTNSVQHDDITATPLKKSEAFKKSTLNDSILNESVTAEKSVRNTPRRSPSRRVKNNTDDTESEEAVARQPVRRTPSRRAKIVADEDTEAPDTVTRQPVRRTPSRRVKQVVEEPDAVETPVEMPVRRSPSRRTKPVEAHVEPPANTEPGRRVVRSPSRRTKAVIDEAALERELREKSIDSDATVDEPAKSPGRRGRNSKPELIITSSDDKAGGDAAGVKTLGPLSANSFMMTMRTKGDGTPDSLVPPEVPSESSSVSAEDVHFNFSEPMAVDSVKERENGDTGSDLKSFIFSPPLTRTRRRQSTDLLAEPPHSILPSPAVVTEAVHSKKAKTTKKIKKNEDKVNLLTPPASEEFSEEPVKQVKKSKSFKNLFKKKSSRSLLAPKSKKS